MTRLKRIIKIILGVALAVIILNFLMVFMSPSGFLFVAVILAVIGGACWLLFRVLFLISGRLGYRKTVHKTTIVTSTILLFMAFTWVPWWQYMFLSVESLSQKDKLNMAPIYWRFFGRGEAQTADFLEEILNRRFEDKNNVRKLVIYLEKSGFNCRKFDLRPRDNNVGTSCKASHMGFIFGSLWHVSINHENNLITRIFISQYLDAI